MRDYDMLKEISLEFENSETIAEYWSPILPVVGNTIDFEDRKGKGIELEVIKKDIVLCKSNC